jgi:hypothetical protein
LRGEGQGEGEGGSILVVIAIGLSLQLVRIILGEAVTLQPHQSCESRMPITVIHFFNKLEIWNIVSDGSVEDLLCLY